MADSRKVLVFWEVSRRMARQGVNHAPNTHSSWHYLLGHGRRCYVTATPSGDFSVAGYVPAFDEELDRTDWVQRVLWVRDNGRRDIEEVADEVVGAIWESVQEGRDVDGRR